MATERKYRLHPEVEEELRKNARKFLSCSLAMEQDAYIAAAEAKVISFDDVYFIGMNLAAESLSIEDLVQMGNAPLEVASTEHGDFSFVVEDDPEFKKLLQHRANYLVGLAYGTSSEENEQRHDNIDSKVIAFHNNRLKNR